MRRDLSLSRLSAAALVAANLIVLAFMLRERWGWAEVLAAYWVETLVIGVVNVLKLLTWTLFGKPLNNLDDLRRAGVRFALTLVLLPYFSVAFMLLVMVSGFFIHGVGKDVPRLAMLFGTSHGISFLFNYLGRAEFRCVGFLELLLQPFARLAGVVVVLAVGFLIVRSLPSAGTSLAFTTSVALCKLTADLAGHLWERIRAAPTPPPLVAPAV